MKIRVEDKVVGMYRVVLGIGSRYSGCVSTDQKDCDERGNIRAVGFWHRHDEEGLDEILTAEATWIWNAYKNMDEFSGAIINVEWKEYRS